MTFWKWSRTASANATADSTCPFPEGMAPSAVNDGVRGLMAAAAKYRDDMSGATVTGGTASAYTLTTNQGFTAPIADGTGLAFWAHTTNAAGATLNVDGTGAAPFMAPISLPLPAGVLVAGTPYRIRYSNLPGWILEGMFGQVYSIPIGGFLPYLSTTPPNSSFALPYGQPISRTTYATLFAMIGTTFGAGDGATTFNIPDLRGRIIVAQDNMGGIAAGRVTVGASGINGAVMGATGGAEIITLSNAQMPIHNHGGSTGSMNRSNPHHHQYQTRNATASSSGAPPGPYLVNDSTLNTTDTDINHEHSINSDGGNQPHINMPPSFVLPMLLRVI